MKVPVYQQQVTQAGIPNVRQEVNTRPADFINPQALAAAGVVTTLADQAQGDFLRYSKEQQALQEQAAKEADEYRVLDGLNQFQSTAQDLQYSEQGWARKTGADVFQPDADGRSLSDRVLTDLDKKRDEIASSLGNDNQRQQFFAKANDLSLKTRGKLLNHEADQYRVYQRGVLTSGLDTEAKNIGLNYNDFNTVQKSLARIDQFGANLGKLEGAGEEAGKLAAQDIASKALRSGINAALQHGNTEAALAILTQFNGRFDADTKTNVQNAITDSWGAAQAQTNPAGLKALLGGSVSATGTTGSLVDAIMQQESGGRDTRKDGSPLISSDQKSMFAMQVTHDTAQNPGFGITPAKNQSAAEYNRIGKELISVYRDRYDGDPAKIAAAYNAGAGAVDTAIERGGDDWQDFIPKATRDTYIPAVLKNLGGKIPPNSPSDARPQSDNPYIAMMSQQDRRKWLNAAESEAARGQSIFAANLKQTITNQYAQAAATGVPGDRISEAQFRQAYDPDQAASAYAEYQDQMDFAGQLYSLKSLPSAQVSALLADSKPLAGSPDFDREQDQYLKMTQAAQTIADERAKDPIAFAQQSGYPIQPVNWTNPARARQELASRHAIATEMSEKYNTPYRPLSHDEVTQLTGVLNDGSIDDKVNSLKAIAMGINDKRGYSAVIRQVKPNSPAVTAAGQLIGMDRISGEKHWYRDDRTLVSGEAVARTILRGDQYLNPGKDGAGAGITLPGDLNSAIYDRIGSAFNGDVASEQGFISTIRAYYAATMDRTAKETVHDPDKLDEAINAITGGIALHAGEQVIPPFGMPEESFRDSAYQLLSNQVGGDEQILDQFDDMPLTMVGNNRYLVKSGTEPLVHNGKIVVLDFDQ